MHGYSYVLKNKDYKNVESFETAELAISYLLSNDISYDKKDFTIAVFYEETDLSCYLVAYINVI